MNILWYGTFRNESSAARRAAWDQPAEVARRTGLTGRDHGNYVSGLREPDLRTLVRIASTLDVTADELIGAGIRGQAGTAEEMFQERISAAVKALKSDELRALVTMIEARAATRRTIDPAR